MRPYPLSLRQRAVGTALDGTPLTVTARTWGIARGTLTRYVRQLRATGDLAPRPRPGRPPRIRPADHPALAAQLAAWPAATLAEHCAHWERLHNVRVNARTMARAIARLGYVRVRRP